MNEQDHKTMESAGPGHGLIYLHSIITDQARAERCATDINNTLLELRAVDAELQALQDQQLRLLDKLNPMIDEAEQRHGHMRQALRALREEDVVLKTRNTGPDGGPAPVHGLAENSQLSTEIRAAIDATVARLLGAVHRMKSVRAGWHDPEGGKS